MKNTVLLLALVVALAAFIQKTINQAVPPLTRPLSATKVIFWKPSGNNTPTGQRR